MNYSISKYQFDIHILCYHFAGIIRIIIDDQRTGGQGNIMYFKSEVSEYLLFNTTTNKSFS